MAEIRIQLTPGMTPDEKMERNRHVFKKGRLEFMGGPVYYEQGHGVEGFENQHRECKYAYPMAANVDPVSHDFDVDTTEQ